MRYESSVTSLSWIPSEAVTGVSRAAFDSGFTHYDDPPPAELDAIAARFRADPHVTVAAEGQVIDL
jgi:hypothetical protein